uniref:Uncharacterized protein n=1 Tax=Arundo donax TaxID=35708 RepID=A0A0A8XVK9_ARUDO
MDLTSNLKPCANQRRTELEHTPPLRNPGLSPTTSSKSSVPTTTR